MPPTKRNHYDIVILGAGPAGLAAAVYAARYNLRTLVFDMGFGRSTWFQRFDNYLGFPKGTKAMKFRELGREQAERLGVRFHLQEPAERVTPRKDGTLSIRTKRRTVTAEAVVIASGVEDVMPDFENNLEYEGRSMYWCILCDGHFVNGKRVLCAGKDDDGVDMTLRLRQFTKRLVFTAEDFSKISRQSLNELKHAGIPAYEGTFKRVVGRPKGHVRSVTLALAGGREKTLAIDAIFHRLGIKPYNDVAKKLGVKLDRRGLVKVDAGTMETNVRNVYAVGDIRSDSLHQLHAATYSATRAVIEANRRLYAKRFGGRQG
ncbi:MAG: NAD(P)/FAD-dependent oxidoreductase [bacterium]|nr:NAD(P)/FAD-dependent oxidoreductase [bacterium]